MKLTILNREDAKDNVFIHFWEESRKTKFAIEIRDLLIFTNAQQPLDLYPMTDQQITKDCPTTSLINC